ncbi:hypothetical protein PSI23_04660 [Xenorhabdus sp. XENO-10]|uniref:Uncharacterized protein n=1 Tax=Xenorhabdus yunnanensis TaxID=3025878 RepID=A0ABT5LCE1_9GAMM|nr:hypothetical protein [Xenorhabdus yunnanensis]MDC9588620.1 hypothetical protein [Xenorhabdus yunnanensis]
MSDKTPAKTAKQIELLFATTLLLTKTMFLSVTMLGENMLGKNIVGKKYENRLTVSGFMENY